jgi:hypothetical protein
VLSQLDGGGMRTMEGQQESASKEQLKQHSLAHIAQNTGFILSCLKMNQNRGIVKKGWGMR